MNNWYYILQFVGKRVLINLEMDWVYDGRFAIFLDKNDKKILAKYTKLYGKLLFTCTERNLDRYVDNPVEVINNVKKAPKLPKFENGKRYILLLGPNKIICKRLTEREIYFYSKIEDSEYIEEKLYYKYKTDVYSHAVVDAPPEYLLVNKNEEVVGSTTLDISGDDGKDEEYNLSDAPDWLVLYAKDKTYKIKMNKKMKMLFLGRYNGVFVDEEHDIYPETYNPDLDGLEYFAKDYGELLGITFEKYAYLFGKDCEDVRVGW